ncbi:MAG: SDR family oxidoreductase [Anaerolineaceae bacterium]|nr:SDR family oxidoreductase [Anaerolineaceae bacterium]
MILVTGAAGHIGNVLVRELVLEGRQVRAFVLPGEDVSSLDNLGIEFVEGNVLDPGSLDRAMRGIDIVFHLAGVISIMPGHNEWMQKVNVDGTKNVIKAAKKARVSRLVYTSSIHALSRNWKGKINESVPFDSENAVGEYDRTKAEASLAVLDAVKDGLDAVIVCPTGVIGPHDYLGSEMGALLMDWLRKKIHFLVKGAYDFVDVRDAAHGHILACDHGRTGEVYILSGSKIKVFELKNLVQDVLGCQIATVTVPMWMAKMGAKITPLFCRLTKKTPQFTDYSLETLQSNSNVSSGKAKQELGYRTRNLAITVRDTVKWLIQKKERAGAQ